MLNTNVPELLKEFNEMTLALAKDGNEMKQEITPDQLNLLHMAVGISGESGELLDAIKKHVIYQKPLDRENVKEEIGDLLFYVSNLLQSTGFSFEDVLRHNIDKLSVRYSSGKYSNVQAQTRADKSPDEFSDVSHTKTPYEQLCDKVLQVSDQETLDKFIKNTTESYGEVGKIDENINGVEQAFVWDETEEDFEYWKDVHYKVQELPKEGV